MNFFGHAHEALLEYALCGLVERAVEGVQAVIKRFGQAARNCAPPYICAAIRETANIERLRRDEDISAYVTAQWRSKRLLDDTLGLRYKAVELSVMPRLQKIKSVYKCTMELEFEDMAASKQRRDIWEAEKRAH